VKDERWKNAINTPFTAELIKDLIDPHRKKPGSHVRCRKCRRILLAVNQVHRHGGLCSDCRRWA
jgi:hypothetical protein